MIASVIVLIAYAAETKTPALSLPPGFDAFLVAGDDLVHDAFVMTVDPKGHILVGGRGFLKVLIDANDDGKAESATTILQRPDLFPMGLWWTDKELLFVSDKGVWSLPMDGLKPNGPPKLLFEVKAKGEHDAHAVKRGPDSWLYLICGNMAGVDEKWAADVNSPVKKPVAGCLVRISPDGKRRQVVADGFRNAYDFDWNAAGDPFTYDSDNERCVSLPWYEGCRLYHVVAGAHHGWQSPQNGEFWRKPPYFFDVAEPLADLGRGSPTGVVCYKHTAFPPKYRDGLFLCDWTFGKIYFATITPSGASYDAKVEVFAKPVGDDGFAPVSAAVHPITGDLLVAIGGRGTRGAVYRIKYSGAIVSRDAQRSAPGGGSQSMVGLAASSHPKPSARASLAHIRRVQLKWFKDLPFRIENVLEGYSRKLKTERVGVDRSQALTDAVLSDRSVQRELKRSASFAASLGSSEEAPFWSALVANGALESWSARWVDELAAEESVPELVHTLICLARCPLPEGSAARIAAALLSLDEKLEKAKAATDRNWPLRIGELHQALAERLPTLDEEIVEHPSFGRPAHALFAMGKSFAKQRPQAAARLLESLKAKPDREVTAEVVRIIATLPAERVRSTMVELWERRGLRDELTVFFARNAATKDMSRLLEALSSPRVETVEQALTGLEKLAQANAALGNVGTAVGELLAAAERSATLPKTTIPKRATIVAGQLAGLPNADREALLAWLRANHPSSFAKLNRSGVDWPAFQQRMANAPWSEGTAERGRRLYEKLGCNACHTGSGLGPDLKGIGSRFSREDLFRSIVDPNKDVSDRYRSTQVLAKSGAVRIGVVVYESADGLLLQTAPAEMVRLPNDEIEEQQLLRTSIMPTGMLKDATERDLADLYAYVKGL